MKDKKVISNFIYSFIGLLFMNGILSLFVYPLLSRQLGNVTQGKILYYTSLMNFIAGAFGSGANYARMKLLSEDEGKKNGPFNLFLLITIPLICLLTVVAWLLKGRDNVGTALPLLMLGIFMCVVRYYADVEFRMNLNYKRFSVFYILIGIGYCVGTGIFFLSGQWIWIFIFGELFGIIYILFFGTIFKKPFFQCEGKLTEGFSEMFTLSGSYFLSDFVSLADRFLFPILLTNGDELTSLYYCGSVVGKMMSLLSTPLNGVLMGYLAKDKRKVGRKDVSKVIGLTLIIFLVVTALSVLGSYIFVSLFYPNNLETVKPILLLANMGQVLFFICNTLMVLVLRYTKTGNQIIINLIYIAVFLCVTIPLILNYGLMGMAWGIFIVNGLKFILFSIFGFFGIREKTEN